ncbi:28 kDa ribonucleoprotein, chloroplastic-like [Silene latifolia]|uniref:28 kDa ribonucleoprotein, chloroplastic-like n=1 Tax=Silene latifolia TaxID=37657 RepID=UPI003D7862F9
MATTTTNPFLKTLAISITTPSLQKPTSLFLPKSLFFTKPTKQFTLSLQKSTIFAPLFVAQTSDWEQESSTNAVLDEEEEEEEEAAVSWDMPQDVSEPEASGFETEDGFSQPPEDAKLYVGNLPYDVDSEKLANMFDGAGGVEIAEDPVMDGKT